jgi:hypothetical protein
MQALPMITPSMVKPARTLLARNACSASSQVSDQNMTLEACISSGAIGTTWAIVSLCAMRRAACSTVPRSPE